MSCCVCLGQTEKCILFDVVLGCVGDCISIYKENPSINGIHAVILNFAFLGLYA